MRINGTFATIIVLLVTLTLGACAAPAPPAVAPEAAQVEADIAAINEIWEGYTAGANTGDLDLWISLWDVNGIRMAPDAPPVIGKEQIRAQMKVPFEQLDIEIAIDNQEVQVGGDWAFSRGTYTLSTTPKAGGETAHVDGKFLTVLKRQSDGTWKIFRDIFNSNVPPD
ncbi:MAG: YybH family protein [Anaerolineae bacterium]